MEIKTEFTTQELSYQELQTGKCYLCLNCDGDQEIIIKHLTGLVILSNASNIKELMIYLTSDDSCSCMKYKIIGEINDFDIINVQLRKYCEVK
ncbi:MAG: hypothetical protein [Siphoviridae sp. ctjeG17]|nr:MAG: hypothetical protein [Siphoviridae sp. ctjeG17]